MIGFLLGIVYGSFMEWGVHKMLFHEHGKKKNSPFAFHLRQHHADCIKNKYYDNQFSKREALGVMFLLSIHMPIVLVSPPFYLALVIYGILFQILHSMGHRNPDWAKKYQPWHWRHHMETPNSNWNVVLPLADWIMNTNK